MRLIETRDLETWARSKVAESEFPQLVKELICAATQPDKLRIPSGDAIWVPGFDAMVMNSKSDRFYPKGLSVWEFGTNRDTEGKADNDYEKRTNAESQTNDGLSRSDTTFVFCTPRIWTDPRKSSWITKRKGERVWKDVIVIDGVDLQDWLENAPSIALRYAATFNKIPPTGLDDPEAVWTEWSECTNPATSEDLIVAGREEQEKELIRRLFVLRGFLRDS